MFVNKTATSRLFMKASLFFILLITALYFTYTSLAQNLLDGDVDCSTNITSVDVELVLNYVLGLVGGVEDCAADSINVVAADVNGDEETNAIDALLIAQCIEGINNSHCPVLAEEPPNILLIIADDMGLDATPNYDVGLQKPTMPNLSALADSGLTFDNVWSYPLCSPTRSSILTGRHGFRTGILSPINPQISTSELSLQAMLDQQTNNAYAHSVIGKWHLSSDPTNPTSLGVDYYAGFLNGSMQDYYNWAFTENGATTTSTEYNTTKITDLAIDWIGAQDQPWFSWVAYSAPHTPFHLPPTHMHTYDSLPADEASINANPLPYYLAMVESVDYEIGRLLATIPQEQLDNTVIIFIGDNGTPSRVVQDPYARGKGSLFQGGIHVPMIVSGHGVRQGREAGLVQTADLFTTIAEIAGADLSTYQDSYSFKPLLAEATPAQRTYNYAQIIAPNDRNPSGYTIRDDQYKLIVYENGDELFYDLLADPYETNDLLAQLTSEQATRYTDLQEEVIQLQADIIEPSDSLDITNALLSNTSASCVDHATTYISDSTDVENGTLFMGNLVVTISDNVCTLTSNAIPNHDFNDSGGFAHDVSEQDFNLTIPANPQLANAPTALTLNFNDALLLNGVKVDLLAAGCYGVGNGFVGCSDMSTPHRYDPMSPLNNFRTDSHNAHAQASGEYHYHGNPKALFDDQDDSKISPVIGFAADGFPIFGSYINDNGEIRKAESSYQLKSGTRESGPGGEYDGIFVDDFEYVADSGDLDVCNGMAVDGSYGYYVTDTYPHILGCFSGTPDESFRKSR